MGLGIRVRIRVRVRVGVRVGVRDEGPNLATLRAQRLAHPTQEQRHQPRRALAQIRTQAAGWAGDECLLAVMGGGGVRVVGVGPVRV